MGLKILIQNVKSIKDLSLDLPVDKGLYAITGENATDRKSVV